ncbi:cytochrome c biogenesis CcdA family protein [Candidatus Caldatribacterium sp. SIUC1]|uniref:cytochrome c biogenesis CcdA family protein n=1 Tax=Candidatus Caldatribacterium sp. SIUC1 TaxID=3418365 RepID=UPI003F692CC4
MSQLNVLVSFGAGVLSFLSPCVLAIAPAYLGYVVGVETLGRDRRATLFHTVFFVLGFVGVFVLLGIGASMLGGAFFRYRFWFTRIAGAVIVLFGLQVMGAVKIRTLYAERHLRLEVSFGVLRSLLLGVSFGLGWTPCVGPVLGSILLYVSALGRVWEGGLLLLVYALGLALPFLLLGAGWGWMTGVLRRLQKGGRIVELASGILLISLGVVLVLGKIDILLGLFGSFNPEAWLVK